MIRFSKNQMQIMKFFGAILCILVCFVVCSIQKPTYNSEDSTSEFDFSKPIFPVGAKYSWIDPHTGHNVTMKILRSDI